MLLAIGRLRVQDYFPTSITDQNEVDETDLRGEEVDEDCFGVLVTYFDIFLFATGILFVVLFCFVCFGFLYVLIFAFLLLFSFDILFVLAFCSSLTVVLFIFFF